MSKSGLAINSELETQQNSCAVDEEYWLLVEFPCLTMSGYLASIELIASSCQNESEPESDEAFYASCLLQAQEIAYRQMESLLDMATGDTENRANALKTLGTILLTNGAFQSSEIRAYCLKRATEALRHISSKGLPLYLINCIEICLSSKLLLPANQRINLLHALTQCADFAGTQFPPCLTFERCARVLHEALLLEIQRPAAEQSLRYSALLMDRMASYPHHLALATLNALTLTSANQSLREMAAAAFHAVTESLEMRWLKTTEDKLASLDSRKERLAQLCREPHDDLYNVQVIFNSSKGLPIDSVDDPRLPAIRTLMSYMMSSVKMANCWSLFGQGQYNEDVSDFVNGLEELTNLAINSGSAGLSHDAVKLLRLLQKEHPELEQKIMNYTESANLRFVSNLTDRSDNNEGALPLIEEVD